MNESVNEENKAAARRGAVMRKAMVMVRCRMLSLAMRLWKKNDELMVKARNEKARAGKLMKKIMKRFLNAKLDAGMKHWHRMTMLVREQQMRDKLREEQEQMRRKSLSLGKEVRGGGLGNREVLRMKFQVGLTHSNPPQPSLSSPWTRRPTSVR
jgi:hypothetical protein